MNRVTEFFEYSIGISPANQTKILYSIVILVVLGVIRFAILKIVWRFTEDPKSRYTWKRSVSFTIGFLTVTSPIVGTFYRSPSPDADAYVEEGDSVKKGQVLCIVEAMKLMNEIESEVDGRIVKILVESAKSVEYGQALFLIDPKAL